MANKSNYFENLINTILYQPGTAAATAAELEITNCDLKIALYTATKGETDEDATVNEASGSGYARVDKADIAAAFGTSSSAGTITSDAALVLSTFTSSHPTITTLCLIDATATKIWLYYNFATTITPGASTEIKVPASAWTHVEA